MVRKDQPDLVYKTEAGKFKAVVDEIEDCHERGQPVLVGTVSVEKSEVLSRTCSRRRASRTTSSTPSSTSARPTIVAQAGRKGAVTISTNMAGRGTDILLGGNAEAMAKDALAEEQAKLAESPRRRSAVERRRRGHEPYRGSTSRRSTRKRSRSSREFKAQCEAEREEVLAAGGLNIVGTERHESRRIDNQLRGRAGRQGDPGASRFYLSLEDDLLRIFGPDRMTGLMERLGLEEDVPIEHRW